MADFSDNTCHFLCMDMPIRAGIFETSAEESLHC